MREDRRTKAQLIDELTDLRQQATENRSLEIRLHVLREALTLSEERLYLLLKNSKDIIFRIKLIPECIIDYVSPSVKSITGYTPHQFIADQALIIKMVHPDDKNILKNLNPRLIDQVENSELRIIRRDKKVRWVEYSLRTLYGENNEATFLEGIATDITERKIMTDQIAYLDQHDSLTGFYNRTFFDSFLKRFEDESLESAGILICDIDGLKLVNDTLGHKHGDQLLITSSQLLRDCFSETDIISRVGGDEFAVLCLNSTKSQLDVKVREFNNRIADYNSTNQELTLSISMGVAIRCSGTPSMYNLYKEADHNMYREKLHRTQSNRNALVQTLMAALEARDFITEGHADRLQGLAALVAVGIGLPEHVAADLRLLAQFHDIGKVGIPDRILFKPGPFDQDELQEMRKHCEIGHRIALSTPDLAPVADWILKHHEWWNGDGYPLGLKGESIPLPCRILSIADAYDAMTSDRPYRKAMCHTDAAIELNRCSGTQFDPAMVDLFLQVLANSYGDRPLPA
ncbi:MAG: diguanylate cyclase domain-containing protein [Ignavibacteriales bacterium]